MNIAGQEGSLNNNRRWCVVARMIFRSGSDGMYCQRVTRRFPPTNLPIGIKLLLSCYWRWPPIAIIIVLLLEQHDNTWLPSFPAYTVMTCHNSDATRG